MKAKPTENELTHLLSSPLRPKEPAYSAHARLEIAYWFYERGLVDKEGARAIIEFLQKESP